MIILSIGTDRRIFESGSAPRARMIEYGKLFKELHIVIFACKDLGLKAEQISENVWIYPTGSSSRFLYPLDAAHLVGDHMKDIHFNVVTAQDPFETGLAGWLISTKLGIPLHLQIHTDFMSKYFRRGSILNRIRVRIAKFVLPKATEIRAVSDRIRDSLARINTKLAAKTKVLPIYSDVDRFKYAPVTVDLHQKYPDFRFIILMASRLTHEKNISLAMQILERIIRKHHDVGLVIVGEGPDKKYLQELALRHNLAHNIAFEPWQNDLATYYRSADVFLTTSLYEGYGLTLAEAAASGTPIISSDVGIASRLIEDGKNGFICDLSDTSRFYEKLVALIEDKNLLDELKENARRAASGKVSETKDSYLEKYKNMLEDAARQTPLSRKVDYLKLIRYIISGGTAAATQILLTAFFTDIVGLWYLISSSIAFIIAVVVSFTLQKFWTFRHKETKGMHGQATVYLLIALAGLAVNDGLMYLFVSVLGIHYLLGQILSGGIIACFNYFLYAKLVFKKKK